jgi:hypothetical protein
MTRQLTILFLYFFVLLAILFFSFPYSNYVLIALTLLFFGYQVYLFLQSARKNPSGEIFFRQQSKSIRPIFVLLALTPTIGYFINGRFNIFQISLFWAIVLFDIIISILTNKLKPIAIVINGDEIELNNQFKTSRNLSLLKALTLNGFTDEIRMTFSNKSDLLIKRTDFSSADIQKLILICIEKSKETLTISDNLKK